MLLCFCGADSAKPQLEHVKRSVPESGCPQNRINDSSATSVLFLASSINLRRTLSNWVAVRRYFLVIFSPFNLCESGRRKKTFLACDTHDHYAAILQV